MVVLTASKFVICILYDQIWSQLYNFCRIFGQGLCPAHAVSLYLQLVVFDEKAKESSR